ncbi:MAG TPA: hypothetical protein VIB00_08580 [Pyrinomonadaceae bacterium]
MLSHDNKTALVIGHPGHELRVFHWLEVMRPAVFVFTDGSGRTGRSRLRSTTRILDQVGASSGLFYGPLTDAAAYAAILDQNVDVFSKLMRRLAGYLIDEDVSCVVGDALEGYNPTHDVCRLVIGAAVEIAHRATGRSVENFEFLLTGKPNGCGTWEDDRAIRLELDDEAFARKMAVARSYSELESEVREAIALNRADAFRVECLRRVPNRPPVFAADHKPFYEQYGEQQVLSGHYDQVIRYREHLLPLGDALWCQVEAGLGGNMEAQVSI